MLAGGIGLATLESGGGAGNRSRPLALRRRSRSGTLLRQRCVTLVHVAQSAGFRVGNEVSVAARHVLSEYEEAFCEAYARTRVPALAFREVWGRWIDAEDRFVPEEGVSPFGDVHVNRTRVRDLSYRLVRNAGIQARVQQIERDTRERRNVTVDETVAKLRFVYESCVEQGDLATAARVTESLARLAGQFPDPRIPSELPPLSVSVTVNNAVTEGDPARLTTNELMWYRWLSAKMAAPALLPPPPRHPLGVPALSLQAASSSPVVVSSLRDVTPAPVDGH